MLENLTCHDLIAGMPTIFKAQAADGINGDIQFHVTGGEPGEYYLSIVNNTCTFNEGTSSNPKMTINAPSEVWAAISRCEIDGQLAFMQGKYTVSGDFGILIKLGALFKST